jgi:alkylhydroperoxidase/carboxymuconolactone decarboxylase family protein YurZ
MPETGMGAMVELAGVFGRDSEQRALTEALDGAAKGAGGALIVSGEAGIGKTALIDALKADANSMGFHVFAGAASADSLRPLLAFSRAFGENLAGGGSTITFSRVFAMDEKGALVASAARGAEADDGAIAGMLTAIQSFVRDSFNSDGRLGRLEYGGSTILSEHGEMLSIAAIVQGREHPDMAMHIRRALTAAEAGDAAAALVPLDAAQKFFESSGMAPQLRKCATLRAQIARRDCQNAG